MKCDLNRVELVLRRLETLNHVEQLLRQAAGLDDEVAREMVVAEAARLAEVTAEYASIVRRYLLDRED